MSPEFRDLLRLTLPVLPLFLLSYEDLMAHRLSLIGLLLLQGFGIGYATMARSLSFHGCGLWLMLLLAGALVGRRETPGLGEGDLYVLSALSLFHPPGELLLIACLAVWLLLPWTLGAWVKLRRREREPPVVREPSAGVLIQNFGREKGASLAELPLVPALFMARQLMAWAGRLL